MSSNSLSTTKLDEGVAVIQILRPGMKMIPTQAEAVLTLRMWDRDRPLPEEVIILGLFGRLPWLAGTAHTVLKALIGTEAMETPWRPPMVYDAHKIRRFVKAKPKGTSFVVCCETGLDNSRLVAEWIARSRGLRAHGPRTRWPADSVLYALLGKPLSEKS